MARAVAHDGERRSSYLLLVRYVAYRAIVPSFRFQCVNAACYHHYIEKGTTFSAVVVNLNHQNPRFFFFSII